MSLFELAFQINMLSCDVQVVLDFYKNSLRYFTLKLSACFFYLFIFSFPFIFGVVPGIGVRIFCVHVFTTFSFLINTTTLNFLVKFVP